MKVSSSNFIDSKRSALKVLIARLHERFPFCSVLAMDCTAKAYSASAQGVGAGEFTMFSHKGFVVRVMDEGSYAEYSFNSFDEGCIDTVISRITDQLIPLTKVLPEKIGVMRHSVLAEEECTFSGSTEFEIHPDDMGEEAILGKLSALRENVKARDGRIIDAQARLNWQEIHKLYLSPVKDMEQNIMWASGALAAMALKGQELKSSYHPCSVIGGAEVMDKMEDCIGELVTNLIDLLDSEAITPGEYECICSPSVTGMIVHEAFGHGVEMDMFVKDRALAKYRIGEQVASPLVTMYDTASNASDAGTYFFDDEGIMAHNTVIIENGILRRGISDLLSASTLGTEPTGNGRRESYKRKAYTRMSNTFFTGGHDTLEDMIASVKYGFLLDEPTSGMEDPKNWGIQCMVGFAREIKDGKFTGKIFSPVVLTGYVPDLLMSISMMSENVEISGSGYCGKGHKEYVKVSDGGPYIKARVCLG